jgi:hypothetical protein
MRDSKRDAAALRGLADAGFDYIEVGHGLGLGASRTFTPAQCSDEEMAAVAVAARGSAKIGAFFIPGVGTADDLRRFRDAGADFVRVGTDVSKSQASLEFVDLATSLGFQVFTNFMKSYAEQPFELLQRAIQSSSMAQPPCQSWIVRAGCCQARCAGYVEVLKAGSTPRSVFTGTTTCSWLTPTVSPLCRLALR